VVSPDGHVRAFDAKANGTVFGSGGGILVLKRLADAIAYGDNIHAVIKGPAVNACSTARNLSLVQLETDSPAGSPRIQRRLP
jgi:acyl transferase domain-containing protein